MTFFDDFRTRASTGYLQRDPGEVSTPLLQSKRSNLRARTRLNERRRVEAHLPPSSASAGFLVSQPRSYEPHCIEMVIQLVYRGLGKQRSSSFLKGGGGTLGDATSLRPASPSLPASPPCCPFLDLVEISTFTLRLSFRLSSVEVETFPSPLSISPRFCTCSQPPSLSSLPDSPFPCFPLPFVCGSLTFTRLSSLTSSTTSSNHLLAHLYNRMISTALTEALGIRVPIVQVSFELHLLLLRFSFFTSKLTLFHCLFRLPGWYAMGRSSSTRRSC